MNSVGLRLQHGFVSAELKKPLDFLSIVDRIRASIETTTRGVNMEFVTGGLNNPYSVATATAKANITKALLCPKASDGALMHHMQAVTAAAKAVEYADQFELDAAEDLLAYTRHALKWCRLRRVWKK